MWFKIFLWLLLIFAEFQVFFAINLMNVQLRRKAYVVIYDTSNEEALIGGY
jgi:hypothetical protein